MSITTTSSRASAPTVSSNVPYSKSDEIEDERLPGSSVAPTLQNSTYLDVADEDFQESASQEQINHFEKLELYNRGTHNGKWRTDQTQLHDQDDWYFCNALTGQMGLSEKGRLLTWRIFKSFDMRAYKGNEQNTPEITMKQYLVAFCIGAHIYNKLLQGHEWSSHDWEYYPGTDCPPKMERYRGPKARIRGGQKGDAGDRHRSIEECADKLGFDDNNLLSCFEKVRTDLPDWMREN